MSDNTYYTTTPIYTTYNQDYNNQDYNYQPLYVDQQSINSNNYNVVPIYTYNNDDKIRYNPLLPIGIILTFLFLIGMVSLTGFLLPHNTTHH